MLFKEYGKAEVCCHRLKGGGVYGRTIFIINNKIIICWSCISNYHKHSLNNCTCTYIKQTKLKEIHTLLAG